MTPSDNPKRTASGRSYRHLDSITALFVAVLILSNITSAAKIVQLGVLTLDGGTLLFPLSYTFGNILTEVYGYARARKVIWLGFICSFLSAVTLAIIGRLPAAADWTHQEAYDIIFGLAPRIVIASLVAYIVGGFANSYTLAKLKILTQGRFLWIRTIGSTFVGQGLDTAIFVLVAFAGVFPPGVVAAIVVSNYVIKCGVEVLFTPFTYALVGWLKRSEQVDHYDIGTNFNPFRGEGTRSAGREC